MIKILKELGMVKLFLLAILIRLLIMPFFFHPDIKTYNWQSSYLKNGIFNIYSYLVVNKQDLPLKEEFVYFPFTYFFLGTYQIIVSPVLGANFQNWLSDASAQAVDRLGTFRYLFILKFPYLILDLVIPFLLIRFLKDTKSKKEVFTLWLFNPVSIAIIYIFSNIDIIPVTLTLISLLLFIDKRILLGAAFLGIAAGFKAYPMLLLPFILLFTSNYKDVAKILFVSIGILIAVILPFWSSAFLNSALISGLTTRIAFPGIPLGFGESLMIGILILTVLFFAGFTEVGKKLNRLWLYILMVLFLLFSGIHYHIQWLLWIMPLISIFFVFQKSFGKIAFAWLGLAFFIPILYDDKAMSVSLFSAMSPLFNLLPTPFLVIQQIYDPYILQGIIHSIIFGISLILVFRSFRFLKNE